MTGTVAVAAPRAAEGRLRLALPTWSKAEDGPATLFLVLVWFAATVSQLAVSLGETKVFWPVTDGPRPVAPWADAVSTSCDVLLLLACATALVLGVRRRTLGTPTSLALLLAPWLVLVASSWVSEGRPGQAVLAYPAVMVGLWALGPRWSLVQVMGYLTVAAALLSLALGAFVPASGLFVGGPGYEQEKPISQLGILAGFLPTGNSLGRYVAMGLPSVLTIKRPWHRYAGIGVGVVVILWTASRTAMAATLVLGVVFVALRLARRIGLKRLVAGAAIASVAVAAVLLPLVVSRPGLFNHRGRIWMFARHEWATNPVFGFGIDYFTRLAHDTVNLGGYAYHGHSVFVQLMSTGGLLVTGTAVLLLGVASVRATRALDAGVEWPVLFLVTVLSVSVLEVPITFADTFKPNVAALLPLAILVAGRPVLPARPTEGGVAPAGRPCPA